ncbi:MAG: hypothetical protein ACK5JT_04585 [Hyphomicrobiaceae bacterium]
MSLAAGEAKPLADEFVARRELIVRQNANEPVLRLASFLVYLSRNNANHGHDPLLIADDLTSGFVAGMLGMGLEDLQKNLAFLSCLGLIAPAPSGALSITDADGLRRLADNETD